MSRSDIQQRYLGSKTAVNFSQVYKEADRFGCSERVYRRVVNQLVDLDLIEKIDSQLQVKHVDKLIKFLNQQQRLAEIDITSRTRYYLSPSP